MRKIEPTTSAKPPSHWIVVSIQSGHCTKWPKVHSTPTISRTSSAMVKATHLNSTTRNGGVNISLKA